MNNELITVATFNFSTDPNFLLFKAALEHHDIPYLAAEENTVNANPFLSISVGGIRVMVHEDDLPDAISIWREISEAVVDDVIENEEDFGTHDNILDDVRIQPILKQSVIEYKSHSIYFVLVIALVVILLLSLIFAVVIEF